MNDTRTVFRIGAATVTRIVETSFALPPSVLFPGWNERYGTDLAQRFSPASLDLRGDRVPLQTHLWVVEVDGLTIVIDTGIGNGKSRPFSKLFDQLQNPVLERLAAAGFDRIRVDYVFNTHLHVDHVGWNTYWQNGRWVPVFPNATYVYGQRERDYFALPAGAPRRMVFEDSVLPLIEANVVMEVPDEGAEIRHGIRFLPTFGHSIGHMAISVTSQGETALFAGDVMHSPVQVYHPALSSAFCLDPMQANASRVRLLEQALEAGATVFPAHFPEGSAGVVEREGDAFRWRYVPPGAR